MTQERDAFGPATPRKYYVDEEGNFAGWMSDEEIEAYYEQLAEEAVAIAEEQLKDPDFFIYGDYTKDSRQTDFPDF